MKIHPIARCVFILAAIGLVVGIPSAGVAKDMKPLKIACIMPFSGAYGFYGKLLEPGIKYYVELLNKDGGVKIGKDTYEVEMVFIDDAADPKRASQAASELLQKGCVANVGCFSLADPLEAVLTPQKILFVSILQLGFDLNYHKYFIGAISWKDPQWHKYEAASMMYPGAKKWGALWYSWMKTGVDNMVSDFKKSDIWFTKKGFSHAEPIYFPMGQMDFTTELTKLHERGVEVVHSGAGPADYALMVKQAHQLGYNFKWFNPGTGSDVQDFIDIAGYDASQKGVGWDWDAPWAIEKGEVAPELVRMSIRIANRYVKEFKKPMTYLGGYDYGINHLRILLDLYQQAGTIDPDKVMQVARGATIRDFQGTWTLGGEKTWGGPPVVKPSPCIVGYIHGDEIVYGAENPMPTLP